MICKVLLSRATNSIAGNLPISCCHAGSTFHYIHRRLSCEGTYSSGSHPHTRVSELPRVDSLIDGCDYKHWLVVMHPPENYPQREEIVEQYVSTLALALGSDKRAMESIYSVSTKYYYAFSCRVSENVIHKIKSFPRVKWVLPDSYLCGQESGYGGEPYIDGKLVPYHEKYHVDWLRDNYGEGYTGSTYSKKRGRRKRGSKNAHETNY